MKDMLVNKDRWQKYKNPEIKKGHNTLSPVKVNCLTQFTITDIVFVRRKEKTCSILLNLCFKT